MSEYKNIRKLIIKELHRLNESRTVIFPSDILYNIGKNVPGINKVIATNSMFDGAQGLYRYEDGNAYEIQVRPIALANDKENWEKYTSTRQKITKDSPKITSEDMKKALWLAFKETADKIEYVGDGNENKFKITYNETFDANSARKNLDGLEELGVGKFDLVENGDMFFVIKHKSGTGDKSVFDELIS